jgi:hypothetical protein
MTCTGCSGEFPGLNANANGTFLCGKCRNLSGKSEAEKEELRVSSRQADFFRAY